MAAPVHSLTIPSSTRYLREVRRFVAARLSEAGVPDSTVADFKHAVDEACANVIEHAYQDDPHHEVRITLQINEQSIHVNILDSGIPFDEAAYQEPNVVALTKRRKSGGLGVHIMRRLMDRVEYTPGSDCNEICLIKYR